MAQKHTYTVFDIETTGLSAACQCEIIEFAGVQLDQDLNLINTLHLYIKPYTRLPKKIIQLTGITDAKLAGCDNRYKALPKIREFIGNSISVAHNASFDVGFINTMCIQQGLPVLGNYICTMKSYKAITKEKAGKLCDACEKMGIELENAHTAIADAMATAKLFSLLMQKDPDLIYMKEVDRTEVVLSSLKNICSQNPNKKIRDVLCATVNCETPKKEMIIDEVLSEFANKKTPLDIAQHGRLRKRLSAGNSEDEIPALFSIWLNQEKMPKFVFMEDPTLTMQVKTMISLCNSLFDLFEIHKVIYPNEGINKGLYAYYWRKYKDNIGVRSGREAADILCEHYYPVQDVVKNFPGLRINYFIESFCKFAVSYKFIAEVREYISNSICGKKDLEKAMQDCNGNFTDNEIRDNPDKIKIAIACALYKRGFFKI